MSASPMPAAYRSPLARRIVAVYPRASLAEVALAQRDRRGWDRCLEACAKEDPGRLRLAAARDSRSGHACPVEAVASDAVTVDRAAGVEHHPAAAADEQPDAVRTGVGLASDRRVRGCEPCL